jgi:serine O-acetyltransferase
VIGEIVTIYPGVVLGRADACRAAKDSSMVGIVIGDGAVLCTGAKVLCRSGTPLAD